MRAVLILAAVAGVVTAAVGLIFMLSSPDEYGIGTRTPIKIENGVGRGGKELAQAAATAPPPLAPLPAAPPLQPSTPKRLIIPKIGVNAPIKSVGLDKYGAIQTPPANNANLVGWYRGGPTAGEAGAAVMLGHKDTQTRSAVFTRLHELQYGDTIEVVRMDGTVAVFTVGGVEQASKQTFPTARVYGAQSDAQLRLITCGGTYNRTTGHYLDNVIVYATMTSTHKAP
jgi:LPXTG-site transpeptidase (sortase) family protein